MSPVTRSPIGRGAEPAGQLFVAHDGRQQGCAVILHERYGLNQHTLDMAQRLAANGFVTVAPDLFHGRGADPEAVAAGRERVLVGDDDVAVQVDTCIGLLRRRFPAAAGNTAVIGVCQSGRYPIVVASRRTDLAACAVLYGAAQDRDWQVNDLQPRPMATMLGQVGARMLFLFAEGDHTISLDHVARVRQALERGRRSYVMRVYPDVPHGFLNDRMPGRYRPQAAETAWAELLAFLGGTGDPGAARGLVWDFRGRISPDYDFARNVRVE